MFFWGGFFAYYTLYIYYTSCTSKSILYVIGLQYNYIFGGIQFMDYLLSMREIDAAEPLK